MLSSTLPFSRRTPDLVGSIIDSSIALLASQKHDVVRFAMGAPSDDLIPVHALDDIASRQLPSKYSYGNTEGEPGLVSEILRLSTTTHDDPNRIVVTTGGMQGLDLAFKIFVDPGDLVVVEGPTYTNAYATARSYGADVREVPLDSDGLIIDELIKVVDAAGRPPKVIYTIPNFQNPSGVTLSQERREKLLELAEAWDSIIIDDDPYGMLPFADTHIPSFDELSPQNPRVFSVRTFSKIIAPGLRLGWVDADSSVQPLLIRARQAMDTCASVPTQMQVMQFLRDGRLEPHVDRVRALYQERKEAMIASLRVHFGDSIRTTDPDGGFFLWVTFEDEGVDTESMFEPALKAGVAFIPGRAFSPAGNFGNAMRLCFATSTPERIEVGVERLAAAFAAQAQGPRS